MKLFNTILELIDNYYFNRIYRIAKKKQTLHLS